MKWDSFKQSGNGSHFAFTTRAPNMPFIVFGLAFTTRARNMPLIVFGLSHCVWTLRFRSNCRSRCEEGGDSRRDPLPNLQADHRQPGHVRIVVNHSFCFTLFLVFNFLVWILEKVINFLEMLQLVEHCFVRITVSLSRGCYFCSIVRVRETFVTCFNRNYC